MGGGGADRPRAPQVRCLNVYSPHLEKWKDSLIWILTGRFLNILCEFVSDEQITYLNKSYLLGCIFRVYNVML